MKALLPVAIVIALTSSGAAMAADDCRRPMAEWQSRDAVTAHVTALGLTTERLRIDDGCYEIRSRDEDGNLVGLKIDPASLAILKLEVRFRSGADVSRYLPGARHRKGRPATAPAGQGPNAPATVTPDSVR